MRRDWTINFSGVPQTSVLGRLLRGSLNLLPKAMALPVLQGRLRGFWWIVGSANHGCWLGSYENAKRLLFEKTVVPGSVVYDIGANVGYYTLLAAELTGPSGQVVAFEPVPRNLQLLRTHLRLNSVKNVTVMEASVSDFSGTAQFDLGESASMGKLSEQGQIEVRVMKLDDLVFEKRIPPPGYLKIDVEGAELKVLDGAQSVLNKFHPAIFLSTHSRPLHLSCCERLGELGYSLEPIGGTNLSEVDELLARWPSEIC